MKLDHLVLRSMVFEALRARVVPLFRAVERGWESNARRGAKSKIDTAHGMVLMSLDTAAEALHVGSTNASDDETVESLSLALDAVNTVAELETEAHGRTSHATLEALEEIRRVVVRLGVARR